MKISLLLRKFIKICFGLIFSVNHMSLDTGYLRAKYFKSSLLKFTMYRLLKYIELLLAKILLEVLCLLIKYMILFIFLSSSSCHAASTDIPDPLSPLLPIVHRLLRVFRATSHILT